MSAAILALLALPLLALTAQGQTTTQPTEEWPVVRVTEGELRGIRMQQGPNSTVPVVYAFLGVPYARPPVGVLRFQATEEAEPWTGIRNATAYAPHCIQKSTDTGLVSGAEDCLALNVFTIDPPEDWATLRRPVMFYIHGGAFTQWSGNMDTIRPDGLLRNGVIVVTVNYRLGAMGFLNTEDSQAPGNAGMKDQVMAMRWVQRNIEVFGGDPNNVTLVGVSAGGCSVHLQMMSPLSEGLYHGAISVSGSALNAWSVIENPRRSAEALHRYFAPVCGDDSPNSIVSCLQTIDAEELVFNQYQLQLEPFQNYFLPSTYLPSVEVPGSSNAPFLTAQPVQLLQEGRFSKVPYMTGHTSADGIVWVYFAGVLTNASLWPEVDDNFADIFRWEMPFGLRTREAAQQVREFYLGDLSLRDAPQNMDILLRFVQLCSDVFINTGTVTSARLMAENGSPIYLYQFSRDGPIPFVKEDYNATYIPGVTHGDDTAYIFDFTWPGAEDPKPIPASEAPIRQRQQDLFTNMIKFGNPTPEGSGLLHWPLFKEPREKYMDMGFKLRVYELAHERRMAFWRQLLATRQI